MITKEDIESCGWNHIGGQMISRGRQDYELGRTDDECGIYYTLHQHHSAGTIEINAVSYSDMGDFEATIYNGKIPDIEALKKLMEWLEIK